MYTQNFGKNMEVQEIRTKMKNKVLEMKQLVEDEFEALFDKKIEITNWPYIFDRVYAIFSEN